MLSNEEKKEMLADAKSAQRKKHFRAAARNNKENKASIDEYIAFLNDVQDIFSPFAILRHPTPTKSNKL